MQACWTQLAPAACGNRDRGVICIAVFLMTGVPLLL